MDAVVTGQSQSSAGVLSPSTLARYFFQDCARFLKFRTATKEIRKRDGIPTQPFDTSAVMKALQDRGATWEEEVLREHLAGQVLVANGSGPVAQRQHSVDATLKHLSAAKSLYQPTLRPKPGALGIDPKLATFADIRPDLIQVKPDPSHMGPRFRIIDIKSASIERFTQKVQVYLYARLLDEIVREEGIPGSVDLNEGAVWLGDQTEPTPFSFADLAPLMETFLREDLPHILSTPTADAFWHLQYRCEWCDYYDHCRAEADTKKDISLVPGAPHRFAPPRADRRNSAKALEAL